MNYALVSYLGQREVDLDRCSSERYLMKGLSEDQKQAIFSYHYKFLSRNFPHDNIVRLLTDGYHVWWRVQDGYPRLAFRVDHGVPTEGELAVELHWKSGRVYTLAFSFSPPNIFSSVDKSAILVTRMQGDRGKSEEFRDLTRQFSGVTPPFLVVAALQGIARVLGIEHVVAVSATRQLSSYGALEDLLRRSYDDVFLALGAREVDGVFAAPLPFAPKPMSSIKAGHKIRTRAKQAMKAQIADVVAEAVSAIVRPGLSDAKIPYRMSLATSPS